MNRVVLIDDEVKNNAFVVSSQYVESDGEGVLNVGTNEDEQRTIPETVAPV